MIALTIYGEPVAQPRTKATTVGGHARMYTPDAKIRPFKQAIAFEYKNAGGALLEGPVFLSVKAVWPRPKSITKKKSDNPECHKASRPDGDNVLKAVMDALLHIAWHDDGQVSDAIVKKRYAAAGSEPYTLIEISKAD